MKKLNNKGISLAETLAALTVIGIVLGVALTAVNSRGIQLKIINDEMEAKFILTDESNRYYLKNNKTSTTPSSFMTSNHIIQKGKDLKVNENIPVEIRDELTELVDDKEYLLSFVKHEDRYYHLVRLTTYDNQDGIDDNLFPNVEPKPDQGGDVKPTPDDKIPPVKPNPPIKPTESENNMPIKYTDQIEQKINARLAEILKTNIPAQGEETLENRFNKDIFRRSIYAKGNSACSDKIPDKITVVQDPLAVQVKMYSLDVHDQNPIEGIESKDVHFYVLLKAEYNIENKPYIDYIRFYGKFNAAYNKNTNEFIITSPVQNLQDPSFENRFWNNINDLQVDISDGVLLGLNPANVRDSFASDDYQADLIRDTVGTVIAKYIKEELLGGNNLN